ncbi:hypothetical protein ACFFJY_17730 [Fictibacillus aquaticus]|uniref:Uncharacterized protein n=1 Tax=Fictibacillus aquaticus TaxID=2021314 RepID=A0A235F7F2_9BACL|nr:hypothetical protein [Fictibacillus aquaticus]OYD56615.1 hypothetical protein CGZ90_16520 [Fictibacillus aquaticus]
MGGCSKEELDPKVQGARQLNKMYEKGKEQALAAAKEMQKDKKDFIIDVSGPMICTYEKEGKQDGLEFNDYKIQQTFNGSFDKNVDVYASKLPVGTKISGKANSELLYTESGSVYSCKYYNGD